MMVNNFYVLNFFETATDAAAFPFGTAMCGLLRVDCVGSGSLLSFEDSPIFVFFALLFVDVNKHLPVPPQISSPSSPYVSSSNRSPKFCFSADSSAKKQVKTGEFLRINHVTYFFHKTLHIGFSSVPLFP